MMSGGRGNDERGKQLVVVSSASYDSPQVAATEASHIYHAYPPPLAKYEDVARDPKLFMETLEKLHTIMGTKFIPSMLTRITFSRVPIIGGKELDLHHLFVEVTSRGGLEKVIKERRWRDVTATFSFPSTATNASFVLRKYYVSLIQHYEQIYFFGSKGWTLPPAPLQTATTTIPAPGMVTPVLSISETQASSQKRRRSTGECFPSGASLPSSMGCPVIGVIDGKFEYGYLVTVTVGTEKLQGILYHIPEFSMAQVQQRTAVYQERGLKDKERYKSEMEEYRQRLKTGPIIRNAVPIQQRLAVPEVMVNTEFKMEMEESGLPETLGNESCSEESDSESDDIKITDKDSDTELLQEAGTGRESVRLAGEPSVDRDGYGLQMNPNGGMEREDASESMTKDSTD
ncbi:high mobility group B protein 15-like protein isoform X1 [Cinnamomum micranthum f. kanehirae]|uniref:High mobility group B protein 15-like protein isoform X1 n=1 Tax=Cinnamomum micranthum f. kanehirae TaxID=337451 RepID=A0A3S3QLS6_9MAGN|nr:high mobility group B protein 15-like protein isoform X1 [Cinnamomum micranthum f. kanehirae]